MFSLSLFFFSPPVFRYAARRCMHGARGELGPGIGMFQIFVEDNGLPVPGYVTNLGWRTIPSSADHVGRSKKPALHPSQDHGWIGHSLSFLS
jgi:hypothetical protein